MFPYLLGLGFLLFQCNRSIVHEIHEYTESHQLQLLACLLVFGIEINHSIVLFLADLRYSLIVGVVLSMFGLICFVGALIHKNKPVIEPNMVALVFVLCIFSLFTVLVEPLNGWDARSIWFFHAKMIYYNGSVNAGGHWSLPSIGFSHPDYPEMIPILAAQIAYVAGYWNEYLPKMGLAVLLVPVILCLVSVLSEKWWHLLFLVVPLLFTWEWLKNGYMDGYLALYAGLATFYWGRWLDKRNRLDLISGILFISIVLGLKNEGQLYFLIVAILLIVFLFFKRAGLSIKNFTRDTENITLFLISISGLILWERKKQIFSLKNDLQLGLNSLDIISVRLTDGSLPVILKYLYVMDNVNLSFGVFLLSLVFSLRAGSPPTTGSIFCFLVAICYFFGIVLIYLATPYDLISFHLPTGNRTMLPVHIILLGASISLYFSRKNKMSIIDN